LKESIYQKINSTSGTSNLCSIYDCEFRNPSGYCMFYSCVKYFSGNNNHTTVILNESTNPEYDQTLKKDSGKPRLTLVPRQIIFDIAKIREYGVSKYGDSDSWKRVELQRYRDAAYRHFLAYLDDPKGIDKESGLTHLAHLACNIAFLCELEKEENY